MTTGKVIEVITEYAGTTLVGGHLAGTSTLQVADVVDFNEDGGLLSIDNGWFPLQYVSTDEEAATITLANPLASDLDADTPIQLYPAAPEITATVDLGEGDAIEGVIIPAALVGLLPEGVRDEDDSETVEVEDTGAGEWIITDLIGQQAELVSGRNYQARAEIPVPSGTGGVNVNVTFDQPMVKPVVTITTNHPNIASGARVTSQDEDGFTARFDRTGAASYWFNAIAVEE